MSGQIPKAPPLRFSLPPTESSEGGRLSSAADGRARTPAAPWKRNRFNEIAMRKSTMGNAAALPRVEYEDVIPFSGYFNNDIFAKSSDKIGIQFSEGDVLFGKLRPYLGNWMLAEFKGLAVGDWWVLKSTGVVSEFLYTLIQTPSFQDVANQSVGSKMPRADWSLVSEALFYCPNNPVEQHRIGSFFRTVDVLIAVREKALGKLEALKKSMLLKMFPQGDALVPEVRFKGFEGEWERRRLGGAFNLEMSTNTLSRAKLSQMGTVRNVHYGDVLIKYGSVLDVANAAMPFIADDQFKCDRKNRLSDGDIIMADTAEDETAGKVTEIRGVGVELIVAGLHTLVLRPNEEYGYGFLGYCMNAPGYHESLLSVMQGSKVLSINKSALLGSAFLAPSFLEQQKIGAYFRSLDALIAARREEVEKLRQMKKALLERMFV